MRKIGLLYLFALSFPYSHVLAQSGPNSFPATGAVTIGSAASPNPLTVNGMIYTSQITASSMGPYYSQEGLSGLNYGIEWLVDPWQTAGASCWLSGWGGLKLFTGGNA